MRIPIHGIGIVAPGAVGIDAFRLLLRSGATAAAEVDRFDTAGLAAHRAALVRDFRPRDFIPAMKMRRMNGLSRLAFAAAKLAIDDCGGMLSAETGVAVGTAFGPVQTSVDYMQEYVERGPALAPPQLFAESVANAPGSHVAIEWGLRGFNVTVTQRESSALAAAMVAVSQIAKGAAPAAIIAGVEEANEVVFSALDRIGALAHASEELDEAARPMDRRRNGFVLGEGGAALVAGAGSGRAYAWFSGFGMARDTTARLSDWGTDASAPARAMLAAIDDAGIGAGDIDAVYCSASGSRRGDALEEAALRLVFGQQMPALVATKGIFGEYAAGGTLHLAAAALALQEQVVHPSVGFGEGGLPLNREVRPAELRHVLVPSLSAGGGIFCAVVSRDPE